MNDKIKAALLQELAEKQHNCVSEVQAASNQAYYKKLQIT